MVTLADIAGDIEHAEVLFCTVVTRSHLKYAWCLHQALRRHHPGEPFCILVVDALTGDELPEEAHFGVPLVRLDAFMTPQIADMTIYYTAYELCGNIKPSFIRHLFRESAARKIIYLDSDLFITGPLWAAVSRLDTHAVTCAPHTLSPLPDDGSEPGDLTVAANGAYNTGFMGFAPAPEVFDLLEWMAGRVHRQGFNAFSRGMFCEQRFFNLGVVFLKDHFGPIFLEGYGVAYWNLHERAVERRDGMYRANGQRVTFFHMSGFDPDAPDCFSKHEQRYTLDSHPQTGILKTLITDYRRLFDEVPFTPHRGYRFDTHAGITLTPETRQHYFRTGKLGSGVPVNEALRLAQRCAETGDPAKAAEICARVLEHLPRHTGALCGYGLAVAQLGQTSRARRIFHQILAIDPDHEEARRHLGLAGR